MVWPLDRQVLNEEWLQRGNSWMKNVVYCRLCICAGRAIYSDLTNVHRGPFAVIWSDSMERQTAWEKAWKPITPIESCALSENANVYKAYDHSGASALSWKSGYVLLPQVSETCLNKGLPCRVLEHTQFLLFKVCPNVFFFFHFPLAELQDSSWTSCGKIVNLMKWLQFFMQNHTVNVVPHAFLKTCILNFQ